MEPMWFTLVTTEFTGYSFMTLVLSEDYMKLHFHATECAGLVSLIHVSIVVGCLDTESRWGRGDVKHVGGGYLYLL